MTFHASELVFYAEAGRAPFLDWLLAQSSEVQYEVLHTLQHVRRHGDDDAPGRRSYVEDRGGIWLRSFDVVDAAGDVALVVYGLTHFDGGDVLLVLDGCDSVGLDIAKYRDMARRWIAEPERWTFRPATGG